MTRLAQLTGVLFGIALAATACSSTVSDASDDDGEGGEGGAGGGPVSTTVTTGTPPAPSPAIAMLRWEYDSPPSSTSVSVSSTTSGNFNTTAVTTTGGWSTTGVTTGSVTTTSGPTTTSGSQSDPNDLMIFLGSQLQSCEDPYASDCSQPYWRVTIVLPPEVQQIGTYSLNGLATFTETEGCDAGFGGGSFWDGTIQITSIDGGEIEFTLAGTNDFFFVEANADGSYSAPRCF
jgi:hypothetical protein